VGDTVKSMRTRIAVIGGLAGIILLAAGCSSDDGSTGGSGGSSTHHSSGAVSKQDAYAVGCPLVDTALGAGTVARKLASAGLGTLQKSGSLSADQKQWVSDAKELVSASKPQDVPGTVRSRVKKACADHGQQLSNL
jgi:hypothetical protein